CTGWCRVQLTRSPPQFTLRKTTHTRADSLLLFGQLKHACSFPGTVHLLRHGKGTMVSVKVLRCLVGQAAILTGKKEQRSQIRVLAQGRLLYLTYKERMIPHIETCPDFTVDVGQAFIQHRTACRFGEVWDLSKLIPLLGGFTSPPRRPLWAVLGQNIDAERVSRHQQLMHIRLLVDTH